MTNVLVCIKRVPDVGGEVSLTGDGQGVDARHVGFTVSAHENCAVELAVRIAGDTGDFQVGIWLAYALGRPVVNGASTVTVTVPESGSATCTARATAASSWALVVYPA